MYEKSNTRIRYLATHEHAKETNTLTDEEREELWECLFLTFPEIAELLQYVESAARHASIFPMVSFCATRVPAAPKCCVRGSMISISRERRS